MGFVHLEVLVHHGREHMAGVGVPCVCSQGVERDEHSTDTQPVPFVRSATLVLSAWLNLPGDTDRGVCPG